MKLFIAEGKTKIVWPIPGSDDVIIESKDDITAGDGARRHVIPGKGALSNATASNVFRLLATRGIPTHFVNGMGPRSFRARRCAMAPLEIVVRRIATGSVLKRHPDLVEGHVFDPLLFEFFLKDDARHDPLLRRNQDDTAWYLVDPKRPSCFGYVGPCPPIPVGTEDFHDVWTYLAVGALAQDVFRVVEGAWAAQDVALADLKLEVGVDANGKLRVADVIDNDSWRLWPNGRKGPVLDKQAYRDLDAPTPRDLVRLRHAYAWVAAATSRFL